MDEQTSVADVTRRHDPLPATFTCDDVHEVFRANPDWASVLVEGSPIPLLVNRRPFYELLSGPLGYGRTLFSGRPIAAVFPATDLAIDGDEPIESAAVAVLGGTVVSSGDDLVVRLHTGWGTVASSRLFQHLIRCHLERAEALSRSEERFRSLVEHAVDIIVIFDERGHLLYRSRHLEGVTGPAIGDYGFANVHPDDLADLAVLFQRILQQPGVEFRGEFRVLDDDRLPRLLEFNARNCLGDPAVEGIVANLREITERRALEDRLRQHAFHDALTGLPNRELLFQRAEYALERLSRVAGRVAALYVDLDGFKGFNDELGHDFGDRVIVAIAERLRQVIRRGDTLARIGGDEFVVLVDECTEDEATELGRRLVVSIAQPLAVDGHVVNLSGSVGMATSTATVSVSTLLQRADSAMYAAKAGGRNRLEQYDPRSHAARLRRNRLGADLRTALASGQLHLVYQPIVETASTRLLGVEALVRWDHPELGPVPPLEFVPIAEQLGLIDGIGAWVLQEACQQLAAWDDDGVAPSYVSVNVSPVQLDEAGFADEVAAVLRRTGIPAGRLQVEVTESALATQGTTRIEVLDVLRGTGVTVAIDDFGTGYSALSYLSQVPIDVVKIDRSFVADLGRTTDATVLLRSIVEMAHSLGHRVTAEGVETDEQLRLLRGMGCDAAQGYLFARPAPATRFRPSVDDDELGAEVASIEVEHAEGAVGL